MHYELSAAARSAFQSKYRDFPHYMENRNFIPPKDGGMLLRFNYIEEDRRYLSIDRKCKSSIAIVRIGVVFPPGSGVDEARFRTKDIADFFKDGKMLNVGNISEGVIVHQIVKHESEWMTPVRFTVRVDTKEI
ncbi:tail terminator [Shigella phage vB_SflS-ISF001]|uniref:Uncharacterized protein n=1 Tax=Shigella phage vB_SflS-ISF001 TaxID=2048005 RepID=A0A2D1GQ70_9CAUD|nr:tail terminator [Shigella phage vB_SflS-ISF001]ATN94108.1 hypothetical protein FLXISF001_030 [Shigella phage vB_SflS-ISF001]